MSSSPEKHEQRCPAGVARSDLQSHRRAVPVQQDAETCRDIIHPLDPVISTRSQTCNPIGGSHSVFAAGGP